MIFYVCRTRHRYTIDGLFQIISELAQVLRILPYEQLLTAQAVPAGHYIFTDIDRLSPAELERAGRIANRVTAAAPGAQVLNHPLRALGRYPLLRELFERSMNPFDLTRLDEGPLPRRFPVFIRREAGADGPETKLINDLEDYRASVAGLEAMGCTRKGRVAVEFQDTRSPDGRYRKYGAIRIGRRIVPQHLFISEHWCVKRRHAIFDQATMGEEYEYVRANPHSGQLMPIFDVAGLQYGRIDYAMVDGRVVTFEINTNPGLPKRSDVDGRRSRADLVRSQILDAIQAVDRQSG